MKACIIALSVALFACPVAAQTRTGAVISGSAGVLSMDSAIHTMVSGSIGYKLNSVLSFGVELTAVPDLESDLPGFPIPLAIPYFPIRLDEVEGSATIFTTNVRIDIPTTSRRIVPFVVGGGGVANVEQRYGIAILPAFSVASVSAELAALGLSPSIFPPPNQPYPVSNSTTGLALTLGGGASIMATDRLSIDVDLRYLRIEAATDRNAGRFGGGVSYRF
jgi:outer membrane protein with beta-barrel domain